MNNKKRVLVISNNCFSPSDSNGRTLGNLFYAKGMLGTDVRDSQGSNVGIV